MLFPCDAIAALVLATGDGGDTRSISGNIEILGSGGYAVDGNDITKASGQFSFGPYLGSKRAFGWTAVRMLNTTDPADGHDVNFFISTNGSPDPDDFGFDFQLPNDGTVDGRMFGVALFDRSQWLGVPSNQSNRLAVDEPFHLRYRRYLNFAPSEINLGFALRSDGRVYVTPGVTDPNNNQSLTLSSHAAATWYEVQPGDTSLARWPLCPGTR